MTLDWVSARQPERTTLRGSQVLLRRVNPESDADLLFLASRIPGHWTYLPDGPYDTVADLRRMLSWAERSADPFYFTLVRLPDERPAGIASYLRITPGHAVVEIGHLWLGSALRRTAPATE